MLLAQKLHARYSTQGRRLRMIFIVECKVVKDILLLDKHPAHPVGVAIRQLLQEQGEWSGEPARLLQTLNSLVSDEQRRAKNWPENARSLGHCLRRLAPALRRAGIAFERGKGTRRIIHLCKARDKTSESSKSSEKCAGKDDQDVSDDLLPPLHDSLVTNGGIVEC